MHRIDDPSLLTLDPLRGVGIAMIGYGNQGRAQALNLRDSGLQVRVGVRAGGASFSRAEADGFQPLSIADAVASAALVIMALPDEQHADVYASAVQPAMKAGQVLGFMHGLSVRAGWVQPVKDVGVVMVAPKGPGTLVRARFVDGSGLPCLLAVHSESADRRARSLALAWAVGIGCHHAAIIETTFADEAETDLFGEQAVLCGGVTALIVAAFETLVEAGYPPELAYVECCQEVKQIADLVYERGLAGMREAISNTAEFGAYVAGERVIGPESRRAMKALLAEIRNGTFASRLRDDHAGGFQWFHQQQKRGAEHEIEAAGRSVRSWMPWLATALHQQSTPPAE